MHRGLSSVPAVRDLVLVGGGHSHVQVLKSLGMKPLAGVRVTLLTKDLVTPYSGMLPGCIGGEYSEDDIHIKLGPLCRFAGARLVRGEVTGLDLTNRQVQLRERPNLHYDVLSINSGAVPAPPYPTALSVKPISTFLPKWRDLCARIGPQDTLAIVGGGAGGVELALAARRVLPGAVEIVLVSPHLLPGHAPGAMRRAERALAERAIGWHKARARSERDGKLLLENGDPIEADYVLWVTDVAAAEWIKQAGLDTDERGFLSVDACLRSTSHPEVFAAGDIAHLTGQERPKSGVYAVRAGRALTGNLRRALQDIPLKPFRAQREHLALIGTADGRALASRSRWSAEGRFWWWLKDRIDRAFMDKFNKLPEMPEEQAEAGLPDSLRRDLPDQVMRCGGCGAKLAADPLRRVLQRLPAQPAGQVLLGIGDDAAQIANQSDSTLLTIDGFRAMLDDPYLFGRIAAHHSLNDIFAMAAEPTACLAFVTVPLMSEALMEEELYQVLCGVTDVLKDQNVPLVGGHSAEGAELSVGLTITGRPGARVLHKGGAQAGDRLLLTKAVGTGVVLAAAMQGRASAASMASVQRSMDQSNAAALDELMAADVTALTDVTGFGLAGHLGEMLRASQCGVQLDLSAVPLFADVEALLTDIQSSLQNANELALQDYEIHGPMSFAAPRVRALADPQTSGGLLAAVPPSRAATCVEKLAARGYTVADIGELTGPGAWVIK